MNERLLSKRYTKALVGTEPKKTPLEDIEAILQCSQSILDNTKVYQILISPAVSIQHKDEIVLSIVNNVTQSAIPLNFFKTLVEKKRINLLPYITQELIQTIADYKNVVDVHVSVSKEATDDVKNAIIAQLKRNVSKDLNCTFTIDESLIGGYKATIGNTLYDGSVKSILSQLKDKMLTKA